MPQRQVLHPRRLDETQAQKHAASASLPQGHIKGYISHQHQKLVVSKQNPFPPLSTVC